MEIDNEAEMIYWKFSGNIFAESVLTNYLKGKQLHAYVSMIHVNDIIVLFYDFTIAISRDFNNSTKVFGSHLL